MTDKKQPTQKAASKAPSEKLVLPTFDDPNSPKALKASMAEKAKAKENAKELYVVLKPQLIDGEWVTPSEDKSEPNLIEQLPVQAQFKLLNGKLKKPSDEEIEAYKKAQNASKKSDEKA